MIQNNRIDVRRVKCSQVYWSEINKIMERPTCYYKWESEYFYATFDWDLIMSYHMNVQQRYIYRVYSLRSFTVISLATIDYIYGI